MKTYTKPKQKPIAYSVDNFKSSHSWAFNKLAIPQEGIDWVGNFLKTDYNRDITIYSVFGTEIGAQKGNWHVQAYIYFKKPMSRFTLHRLFPGVALNSMQPAIEDPYRNHYYCTKENICHITFGDLEQAQKHWENEKKLDFFYD